MRILLASLVASVCMCGPALAGIGNPPGVDSPERATPRADLRRTGLARYATRGAHEPRAYAAARDPRRPGDPAGAAGAEPGDGLVILVFIKFDANHDGKLNQGEYEAALAYLQAVASRPGSY